MVHVWGSRKWQLFFFTLNSYLKFMSVGVEVLTLERDQNGHVMLKYTKFFYLPFLKLIEYLDRI